MKGWSQSIQHPVLTLPQKGSCEPLGRGTDQMPSEEILSKRSLVHCCMSQQAGQLLQTDTSLQILVSIPSCSWAFVTPSWDPKLLFPFIWFALSVSSSDMNFWHRRHSDPQCSVKQTISLWLHVFCCQQSLILLHEIWIHVWVHLVLLGALFLLPFHQSPGLMCYR